MARYYNYLSLYAHICRESICFVNNVRLYIKSKLQCLNSHFKSLAGLFSEEKFQFRFIRVEGVRWMYQRDSMLVDWSKQYI